MKPLEIMITTSKKPVSANKLVKLSCESSGSRPAASLTWWLGSKKLTKADNKYVEEVNLSKSVLTLVPSSEDDGKFLVCRVENPNMPNSAKEDGYRLQVNCEYLLLTLHLQGHSIESWGWSTMYLGVWAMGLL